MVASDNNLKNEIVNNAIQFYTKYSPISQALESEVYNSAYLIKLQDGEVLVEQGEICPAFYFVGKGVLVGDSVYDRKRVTTWFTKEGSSGTSVTGMYGVTPSLERIYAYGETYLVAVNNDHILSWYNKFPEFNIIMRKMFEFYLQSAQQRASMLRMSTARKKYAYFKKAYSDYINAVSVDLLANFMGIKSSTLAFIIKEEQTQFTKDIDLSNNYQTIINYLEKEKCYLQSSLTLKQLAKDLHLSTHKLSEIINKKSNKNFNDFINTYRIAYVQERLKDRENWKHLKLESLGIEAGFKSRSSFFSVFKKQVGVSPLVFIKSI